MSSEVQIAVIDQQDTQIVLAVPGVQGATGSEIAAGGTANQVLRKASSTDYDTDWSLVTSAMIEDGTIVNADVDGNAAIAGTKISPNFGSQAVVTTGTSTAASFIPTSNTAPTNGLYLPAANNVAISTNGEGRLFVDANGRCFIGTNSSTHSYIQTIYGSATGSRGAGTVYQNATTGVDGSNGFLIGNSNASDAYLWNYENANTIFATNATERLYITSTGELKHIGGGSVGSPGVYFAGSAPSNSLYVQATTGNVGLGTSSPATAFEIEGNQPQLTIDTTTTGYTALLFATNGVNDGGIYYNGTDDRMEVYTADTSGNPQAVIDAAGNVGIGVTTPGSFNSDGSNLVVGTGSGGQGMSIYSGTSSYGTIYFADGTSGDALYRGAILYNHSSDFMRFDTAAGERMRIDSSGKFIVKGVGTEAFSVDGGAPNNSLIVDSSGRCLVGTSSARTTVGSNQAPVVQVESTTTGFGLFTAYNQNNAFGSAVAIAKSRGTTVGSNTIVQSEDQIGGVFFYGADGVDTALAGSIECYVDGTPGSNDMPGRLVFSTNGGSPDTSPTPRMVITSSGATKFSGTIAPSSDNVHNVGGASLRWSTVYATTGTINTSDANLKQDIEDLDAAELLVATAIKGLIKKFRFTDAVSAKGDDARIHVGVIAQEVEQAFASAGLDPRRYGMFCEDELEDGTKRLGIRYDELLAFVIAAL
jgi:hypothetical protein